MVYRRYARRRTYRRKTLSNYRIATRTSARSQAKQIYALKRRINVIQRRTKPEILITRRTGTPLVSDGSFTPVTGLATFAYGGGSVSSFQPQLPTSGTETNGGAGVLSPNRFARLLSFKLTGSISYSGTPQTTATPYVLRVVIVQTRTTRSDTVGANDIFLDSNPVFNSLQSGLARTARVLSDKRYYLSYQRPVIAIKTVLKRLTNFYTDTTSHASATTGSEGVGKGTIFVAYAFKPVVNPSQPEGTVPSGDVFVNWEGKLAYTDA